MGALDESDVQPDVQPVKKLNLELVKRAKGWYVTRRLDDGTVLEWGPSVFLPEKFGNRDQIEEMCKALQITTEQGRVELNNLVWRADLTSSSRYKEPPTWNVSLRHDVIGPKKIRLQVMGEEEPLTGWVTLDNPEKIRTSINAKPIRDILKKHHPADYVIVIERMIEQIQRDIADIQEEKKRRLVGRDEEKKPVRLVPFVELQEGRLAEEGYDGKEVFFLVYDLKSDRVDKTSEIELEDLILRPIDNDEVRDGTVLLPSDVEEYGTEEQLTEELRTYLDLWHEPPNELSRILDVFYAFLTHIFDLIPQLPYRRYLAPWGKGKSAWLETLGWTCYRGIVLAGSDTDKSVVRKMNNWRGTALIDEADFGDSSLYAFLVKILNIGYDSKTGFYHRSDENDPNKIISYCVYGPKLLATRARYKDLALESRCLTTIGRQNVNLIPLFRMAKFMDQALHVRNKLILWRFRNYFRIKKAAAELEEPAISEKVYDGANGISSRVKQVILPLWLIGGDAMKDTLTDLAKSFDTRLKIEDPQYLLELQAKEAVREIVEKAENDPKEVNIRNLVNILYEDPDKVHCEIALALISKTILAQQGVSEEQIKSGSVKSYSKRLKSVFESNLGFNIRIGKKRSRVVLIPAEWIKAEEKKPKRLIDFIDKGGSNKDIHQNTNTHHEDEKATRSFTLDQVAGMPESNRQKYKGTCHYCSKKTMIVAKVETYDGERYFICEDCRRLVADGLKGRNG